MQCWVSEFRASTCVLRTPFLGALKGFTPPDLGLGRGFVPLQDAGFRVGVRSFRDSLELLPRSGWPFKKRGSYKFRKDKREMNTE